MGLWNDLLLVWTCLFVCSVCLSFDLSICRSIFRSFYLSGYMRVDIFTCWTKEKKWLLPIITLVVMIPIGRCYSSSRDPRRSLSQKDFLHLHMVKFFSLLIQIMFFFFFSYYNFPTHLSTLPIYSYKFSFSPFALLHFLEWRKHRKKRNRRVDFETGASEDRGGEK